MHILAYSDMFPDIFKALRNHGILRTLVYSVQQADSEPWYIQNSNIFKTLVYSEPGYIQNPSILRTLVY